MSRVYAYEVIKLARRLASMTEEELRELEDEMHEDEGVRSLPLYERQVVYEASQLVNAAAEHKDGPR
jgi:hypothetical protein